MRRTVAGGRPVTQMSSIGAAATPAEDSMGGEGFKLDLRDECTATAKLEKLKAKYQRATAASKGF